MPYAEKTQQIDQPANPLLDEVLTRMQSLTENTTMSLQTLHRLESRLFGVSTVDDAKSAPEAVPNGFQAAFDTQYWKLHSNINRIEALIEHLNGRL